MSKHNSRVFRPKPGQYRCYHFPPLMSSDPEMFDGDPSSYQEDYQNGFDDGQRSGFEQGYQEGKIQGIEAGHLEGMKQGIKEGTEQGLAQTTEQLHGALSTVEQLKQQMEVMFHHHVRQQSEMICDLVHKVARQVLRAELTLQPTQMVSLIDETLAQLPEHNEQVKVFLNPSDLQRLVELTPESISDWSLTGDPALNIGSCRVVIDEAEALSDTEERLETCMETVKENLISNA
ncbi:flagellar assembly protein H [Vibrio harveyi]|nr:flagellar assembly protein H [Vibrio harveyi]